MSANIEVCHIRRETTREEKRGSFLRSLLEAPEKSIYTRFVAEVARSSGKEIIAETVEFLSYSSGISDEKEFTKREQIEIDARNQMIQQLLNDGWEVMTTNDRGEVQSLKRQIGTTQAGNTTSPADLLKQLASLRDAGVLTEEEFQVKKAELLKRI